MMLHLRTRPFPLLAAVILLQAWPAAAQGLSGLSIEAGGLSLASAAFPYDAFSVSGGTAILRPGVLFGLPPLELSFKPRLRFGTEAGAELSVDELALGLRVGEAFSFRIGRFTRLPGKAFILSNLDYFSAFDFERLIEEGPARARLPDDLFEARYRAGPWRFAAVLAPFAPRPRATPVSSAWLPLGGIEESFVAFGTTTYTLRNLAWEESAPSWGLDPAYSLEAGLSFGDWELTVAWFDGMDREQAVAAKATTLDVSAAGSYDLILRHEASRVRRIGASAGAKIACFSVLADAAWFWDRLLAVGTPYEAINEWQGTMAATGIEYTFGAELELPLPDSLLAAEWRNSFYTTDVSSAVAPFLERAAAARAAIYLPSGLAGIELLALYCLEDGSYGLFPALVARPAPGKTVKLDFLAFAGDADSSLGRYAESGRASLSFVLEF